MRQVLALLLALLALSACGAEGPGEDVPPEEMRAVSEERDTPPAGSDPKPEHPDTALPELKAVEPLSAPALVTEGRAPAEDYRLPPSVDADPDRLWENYQDWAYSGNITGLLAEVPEADAAFYGLPLPVSGREPGRALIRWGDSLAEFDWRDGLPRMVRPQLYCFDADRDQQEELVIISHAGGGTGISIEELHVIEKGPDGTLTDYQFPRSLWQEQMSERHRGCRYGSGNRMHGEYRQFQRGGLGGHSVPWGILPVPSRQSGALVCGGDLCQYRVSGRRVYPVQFPSSQL